MTVAKAQTITLTSRAPVLRVTGIRGQTAPIPSGGFGGWTQVARPRRKALTQWDGIAPVELTFSILFDGYAGRRSVEAECLRLERMARPASAGAQPPIVDVDGAVPHAGIAYVIDDLTWDPDPIYSRATMDRLRHEVTVKLLEYVPADLVQSAAATARATSTGSGRVYVVKRGDTLQSIAAAQLGSYKRWTEIATLHSIRDPRSIHVGQRLRLPS